MAITLVGVGTFTANAAGFNCPYPAGGASGDLILLFVSTANQALPSAPTLNGVNMTAVGTPPGTGTGGAAGGVRLEVYRAFHGGTDYAAAIADSGSYQAAVMVYLRGVDSTTPLGTPATRVDSSATTTVTWPSPGSPSSGQWVIQIISLDLDAANNPYDVFSSSPSQTGSQGNLVISGSAFDNGVTVTTGAGGGLWAHAFDTTYALSGGTYANSTTHAQMTFIVNPTVSQDATLTTTTGNATAAGVSGAITGTTGTTVYVDAATVTVNYTTAVTHQNAVLNTDPAVAVAAGGTGSMFVGYDATLTTTTGNAGAGGEQGALTGGATLTTTTGDAGGAGGSGALTADGTLTTTTGDATAQGGTGSMTGGTGATLTTTTGDAVAGGGSGALTGQRNVTLTTTTGDATAGGGTGSIVGSAAATITTTTGDALAGGGTGALTASSSITFTTETGDATAGGGSGALTADATFSTTTGNAIAGGGLGAMYSPVDAVLVTLVGDALAGGATGALIAALRVCVTGTMGKRTVNGSLGDRRVAASIEKRKVTATIGEC